MTESIETLPIRRLFADRTEVEHILNRFDRARIAVVGDFFLDRYLVVDPRLEERSIETDLAAHQVVEIRNSPGAAGTVVNNLVALGCGLVHAIGIIGNDGHGHDLKQELHRLGVATERLIVTNERPTPTYTKPISRQPGGEREMERLDVLPRSPTPASLEDRIIDHLADIAGRVDVVIALDQMPMANTGVWTDRVREALAEIAMANPRTLFFADSRSQIGAFRQVLTKPNLGEAFRAAGLEDVPEGGPGIDEDSTLARAAEAAATLMARSGRPVLVTMGSRGILVRETDRAMRVPAVPVTGPIDVTGAGDSATAGIVLSMVAGTTLPQAVAMGNLVASITIRKLGTTGTASPEEVAQYFETLDTSD